MTSDQVHKDIINFLTKEVKNIEQTSIIIETSYIELIKIKDKNRISHYLSAFALIYDLTKLKYFENLKESVFLDAFINDFNPNYCMENCSINEEQNENPLKRLRHKLTIELNKRNIFYSTNKDHVKSFYMTTTRNNVTKKFKKILIDVKKKGLIEFEEININTTNLYVNDRNQKRIHIGYKKGGAIIPNCALLMAEHYYELFEFAYMKNPTHKEFWIVDFLQYFEVLSCEQGIEVANVLFSGIENIEINIINCNYTDNRFMGIRHLGPYKF
jgi:hypothetical protein